MTFKRRFAKPDAIQQARQDKCREMGCIACRMNLEWGSDATGMANELHHLTISGRQIGQDATVCLCAYHHRNICAFEMKGSDMRLTFGPSLAGGSKAFHALYGDNEALLEKQNRLIA